MAIKWNISQKDRTLIEKIIARFVALSPTFNDPETITTLEMNLVAIHLNCSPLRLSDLLSASPFDLSHDVLGIAKNISREDASLANHFVPRYQSTHKKLKGVVIAVKAGNNTYTARCQGKVATCTAGYAQAACAVAAKLWAPDQFELDAKPYKNGVQEFHVNLKNDGIPNG